MTTVMVEGRRVMRLRGQLGADAFEALLRVYEQVVGAALAAGGGTSVEADGDTVTAAFASAADAVLAAVGARDAIAAHAWPHGRRLAASIGVDAGPLCADLCDAAEAGEIFVSAGTARLVEGRSLRDLGERTTRRTGRVLRVYEVV